EATVYKVYSAKLELALALKLWNKRIPTDVERQYGLLIQLREIGLSVPKPYGWGRNSKGEYILFTSYDGKPLPFDNIESSSIYAIANLLVSIHSFKICSLEEHLPRFDDFIDYFFPGNEVHSDISGLLQEILKDIEIRTDCLIHGDYNLGNILANHGHFTVIDWTNAQQGDSRYDFAWASFLIKIYSGDECYGEFVKTYIDRISIDFKDIYLFEIMACLRWIWLSRIAPIPLHKDTKNRVKKFIEHHRELEVIAFTG
ncbi:MAG: phosphotransferase enzyme family protein, partial [Paenibacillus sp.]|nr:phosphotransferase enzyme family protein [Paenibacillus sp.]